MVVITGASDGLGKALAMQFVLKGIKVIGISRGDCPDGVEHVKTDLRDPDSINKAASIINKIDEPIQALINCAGVLSLEKADSISRAELDRVFETNVRAPMLFTSQLLEKLKKDHADIVNVASTVGFKGYEEQAVYGASKWAIRGYSANLQTELKNFSCRVISFCPGGFKTKLFAKATGTDNTLNENEWMRADDLAKLLINILELPKIMEVSEIVINRKPQK